MRGLRASIILGHIPAYVFYSILVSAFILPITLSDKTEEEFEYAAAQAQPNLANSFSSLPGETRVDKLENKANILTLPRNYSYDPNFPDASVQFGPVTAVCMDNDENVAVLHRYDRVWDATTFLQNNLYRHRNLGAIPEFTVVTVSRQTGKTIRRWGKNLFYMPHGLTIDRQNNAYVTDVALHQVFRFNLNSSTDTPTLILGQKFTPGTGNSRFCKPTSVAVLSDGSFFVADGYCNARIMEFNAAGQFIRKWGQNTFSGVPIYPSPENYFAIPHALTLVEEPNRPTLLCVADRENGRVQCFDAQTAKFVVQYHSPIIGSRIFSVTYANGNLFVVNGPEMFHGSDEYHEVNGFVIEMSSGKVISKFGPNDRNLSSPHDVAVTRDGQDIFVAELDPNVLLRFTWNNGTNRMIAKQLKAGPEHNAFDDALHMKPEVTIILASAAIFAFCIIASGFVILMTKRRRRGCLPLESRNRRHAWDTSGSSQQFKLGNLLDRKNKKGFEKLGQDASDDENSPGGPNSRSVQQGLLSEHYT